MWGERRRKWRCYPPAARKELPTSQFTDISPGPHGWVPQAQSALDELSAVRTLAEAEARFGSARRLSELVLGFPVSGGHATRRVIRAVGQLLRHPLGPAIAAEALSWAASIADAVDASQRWARTAPGGWTIGRLPSVPSHHSRAPRPRD